MRARAFRAGFLSDADEFVSAQVIPSEDLQIDLAQLPVPERRCDECGEKFQPEHFGWRWCGQCCDAARSHVPECAKVRAED